MSKRHCKQKTKAGKPCKAWALHGTDRCISHSDKVTRAAAGFGGAENGAKGGAAGRVPRLAELLRAEVEARAEEIVTKLFQGLVAQRAIVVGTGPKARLEFAPDPDLVLKTIREIFDRAEGRPLSRTEGRLEVRNLDQMDREIERLTERLAASNGNRGTRQPSRV